MPKNSRQEHNYAPKKPYTRAPIHQEVENEEDIIDGEEEEEEEENFSNLHQRQKLYPDLREDLHKSREALKSKHSGRKGKISEQLVMSENADRNSHTSILIYIISVLILIVVAIGGIFIYNTPKKPSDKIADVVTNMQNLFQMKTPDVTFKILNSALTKVVNEKPEPRAPAIFTVLANKGAEKTASDFSVYLAEALAPGSFLSINESLQWHNNPDELKFEIDTKIRSKLDNGILNVIIVDRLNDIPIDAAMIFHSFCDHESAPFKRAVYLFIVHLGKRIPGNSDIKEIDKIAMESLRNIWMTAKEDVVDSLIARITVNVVSIA